MNQTILHLTDIHFGSEHAFPVGPHGQDLGPTLLKMIIRDLSEARIVPDVVIVSGDLVSTGSKNEFEIAANFLGNLSKELNLPPERFLMVPGNHDVFWGAAEDKVSQGEYAAFASRFYKTPVDDTALRVVKIDDIAIVGLDTTILERQTTSGIGLIGHKQLSAAEEKLKKIAADARIKLLVIHHHLLPVAWMEPGPPESRKSLTLDAPAVLAWAQELGFTGILHGHQHQSYLTTFHFAAKKGGPLLVAGGPSAGGKDLPPQTRNGFHVFFVDGRNITVSVREVSAENRIQEAERVEFVRETSGTFAASALPSVRHGREPELGELRALTKEAATRVLEILGRSYGPHGGLRATSEISGREHVRDGGRIVESIGSGDPIQKAVFGTAVRLTSQVAAQVGDGRKTATLIWARTVIDGLGALQDGVDESVLIRDIEVARTFVLRRIAEMACPASNESLRRVATCAAMGNESISSAVFSAIEKAGKEGVISLTKETDTEAAECVTEVVKTNTFEGFDGPSWFQELIPSNEVELHRPLFLIFEGVLDDVREIIVPLEIAVAEDRPIVLIAKRFGDEVTAMIGMNSRNRNLQGFPLQYRAHLHTELLSMAPTLPI